MLELGRMPVIGEKEKLPNFSIVCTSTPAYRDVNEKWYRYERCLIKLHVEDYFVSQSEVLMIFLSL